VDVARPLIERVLQQPVDDVDDVGVVRVRRLQLAEFEHLLEVRDARDFEARVGRFRDRPRHRVELEHVAGQVLRVRDDPLDLSATQRLGQHAFPRRHERLGAGDDDFFFAHFDGEDVVPLRERVRHHFGRLVDVHLQRVDAVIRLRRNLAQPVRQFVEVELLAGPARVVEFPLGDDLERVHVQLFRRARRDQDVFGVTLRDDLRADQIVENGPQIQQALRGDDAIFEVGLDCRHGIPCARSLPAVNGMPRGFSRRKPPARGNIRPPSRNRA
jgi:hypothetical protein